MSLVCPSIESPAASFISTKKSYNLLVAVVRLNSFTIQSIKADTYPFQMIKKDKTWIDDFCLFYVISRPNVYLYEWT